MTSLQFQVLYILAGIATIASIVAVGAIAKFTLTQHELGRELERIHHTQVQLAETLRRLLNDQYEDTRRR